jgi:hypothetical protein
MPEDLRSLGHRIKGNALQEVQPKENPPILPLIKGRAGGIFFVAAI